MHPKPLSLPPSSHKRPVRTKAVTVGIAAACNSACEIICATDGKVSYGDISADVKLPKMAWFGDWTFLYSGEPSNTDLIFEELRIETIQNREALSRENIHDTVSCAFKKRLAKWSADRNLCPYGFQMQEFLTKGKENFGEAKFAELCRNIEKDTENFRDELLVIGYGKSHHAAMLYEVNVYGENSHALTGLATIGSGRAVAMSTLLLLGCGRDTPFEDTLYAVAAAKFAAERCDGVGKDTTMFVTHKRTDKDKAGIPPGRFIPPEDVEILRDIWEKYSRPKIPDDALLKLHQIAQRAGSGGGVEFMMRFMRLASETSELEP
jgi:hypothetical protein